MNTRERLLQIAYKHKLSHLGSCLTALPIIEEIYAIKRPGDIFVLSSGHAHLAHLVVMEKFDLVDAEQALEYGIHCDVLAGCDVSTGSLGLGITIAVGMALADRRKSVYCLISDGEMAEGSVWEALNVVHKFNVENFKLYVNVNGYCAYDSTEPEYLRNRLIATKVPFEWRVTNSDLNNFSKGVLSHYKIMKTKEDYDTVLSLR